MLNISFNALIHLSCSSVTSYPMSPICTTTSLSSTFSKVVPPPSLALSNRLSTDASCSSNLLKTRYLSRKVNLIYHRIMTRLNMKYDEVEYQFVYSFALIVSYCLFVEDYFLLLLLLFLFVIFVAFDIIVNIVLYVAMLSFFLS